MNFTSETELRIFCDASNSIPRSIPAGIDCLSEGSTALMPSTTAMVLVPGCFCTANIMDWSPLIQNLDRLVVTLSITRPSSFSRTGLPLR